MKKFSMKTIYYFIPVLIFLLSLGACQSEQEHSQSEIAQQESLIEEGGEPEAAEQLIQQYLAYADMYPDDADAAPRYLYRAAALQYRLNNFSAAQHSLEKAIATYYEHENTPKAVLLLGNIFQEKLRNRFAGSILYQSALESMPALREEPEVTAMNKEGFGPVTQRLEMVANNMYRDSSGRVDLRLANDFITGAAVYALVSPDADRVPEFLYKAGETARTIQAFGKAIELYDQLLERYPTYEKVPQAMFLKAFTLDNDLRRLEEARMVYEDFLVRYPEDEFADDTQFLLNNLGKSDEEIIGSFGAQQAEQ